MSNRTSVFLKYVMWLCGRSTEEVVYKFRPCGPFEVAIAEGFLGRPSGYKLQLVATSLILFILIKTHYLPLHRTPPPNIQ